jgi:hypothetical protein
MQRANELRIPLKPEDLSVRWRAGRRIADASYTEQIQFFPSYPYPVLFSFNVDTPSVGTPPDDDDYPPVRK